MYRRGELVSIAEGALVGSIPRQTIGRWLRESGIDPAITRQRWLARNQIRAEHYQEGLPPMAKPSGRQLRAGLAKSLKRWNEANTKRIPPRMRRGWRLPGREA